MACPPNTSPCPTNIVPWQWPWLMNNWSPQPWMCNEYGQIPPTVYNPCATGVSYVKQTKLTCYANDISAKFHVLLNDMVTYSDQTAVLVAQQALLITAMSTYSGYTTDPAQIFARDDAVNAIIQAITTSINLLHNEPNYQTYLTDLNNLVTSINTYFQYAGSAQ